MVHLRFYGETSIFSVSLRHFNFLTCRAKIFKAYIYTTAKVLLVQIHLKICRDLIIFVKKQSSFHGTIGVYERKKML